MSFSLHGLFRGIALLAIASTICAVSLGRFAPKPAHFRMFSDARYSSVSGYYFSTCERVPRFLDVETGKFMRVEFKGNEVIDCATCSPWQDEQGAQHLVARWNCNDPNQEKRGYGLSRFTFPAGEEVERYELDVVPTSRPCFFRDTPGCILFAAGDGVLYRFQFPEMGNAKTEGAGKLQQPQSVKWRTTSPVPGKPFVSDPMWPTDPRFGGRLIVSLTYLDSDPRAGHRVYRRAQLWWLKLNPEATEIIEAGRILSPSLSKSDLGLNSELRSPTIAVAPDGTLVMAYLQQPDRYSSFQLRLAPVRFEGNERTPIVDPAESRVLCESCATVAPIFSGDGRWVYCLEKICPTDDKPLRFSVPDALGQSLPSDPVVLDTRTETIR